MIGKLQRLYIKRLLEAKTSKQVEMKYNFENRIVMLDTFTFL
jgi:hypothetical protein